MKTEQEEKVVVRYGRRKTDLLPGVVVREDGRFYLKASDLHELNQQARNLSVLMDAARSIMAEMDLDSLLVLIMDAVTGVMRADRSTLFLIDEEAGELWSRVAQGADDIRIPLGAGISGHVAATGETVNIPDAYADDRFNPEFDRKSGYRTKSILCMPVSSPQGEIIGAIQVLNKEDGSSFVKSDEQLLGAFTSLAGISLANAQAYEELQKERDLLEVRVADRTRDLEQSRKQSDELLLNILPARIADELKADGKASSRGYDFVTVLFTDFKGFTMAAEKLPPAELVKELDNCFYYFDEVVERHGMEKIKTIGDAYMCAGGLPEPNRTNPVDAVLAGLEIVNFMKQMEEIKTSIGEPYWEIRLGIHSGPVTAGVVGKKKFAYDIWGDTVNVAARMESSGEPGRLNISEATYELVQDLFVCTYRGKVPAKNKGEINMYFVESIRPELSLNGDGLVPSEEFGRRRREIQNDS